MHSLNCPVAFANGLDNNIYTAVLAQHTSPSGTIVKMLAQHRLYKGDTESRQKDQSLRETERPREREKRTEQATIVCE